MKKILPGLFFLALCSACTNSSQNSKETESTGAIFQSQTPTAFEVDPFWPKQLPNNWILGEAGGIATDANDHIWIVQRPGSLDERETRAANNPPESECCIPAPSVIEFDQEGNVLQAWGNPDTTQTWITSEHGIFVDLDGTVWIGGSGQDHVVLKFTNDGKPLLQLGEYGQNKGSNDTSLLGGPADIAVDHEANEVYIADGYTNRRVIVYDATTGEYKRHWGAYGEAPHDNELPAYNPNDQPIKSFRNPVHSVRISIDNLVYAADRVGNRIQVFNKDGSYVSEGFVATQTLGIGAAWDIEFSPDSKQTYMYIADGMNMKVWILERSTMRTIGSFGHGGRNAGQFGWIHNLAMDSKGNLYTSEVRPGKRIQKFRPVPN